LRPDVTVWIETLLLRELATLEKELLLFPSEDLVWSVVPGIANSSGTLTLHVSGNLQHYLGAVLGASGYVRNRELEFSSRGVPRATLVSGIHETMRVVREVLPALTPERLALEYPEAIGGTRVVTGLFLVHLGVHLAHHLGQVGYLRRVLTGEDKPSGAISVKALA
jgi:hypothetical protein